MKYTFFLQEEVVKMSDIPSIENSKNVIFKLRDIRNWREVIDDLVWDVSGTPVVFCSIQVAKYIQRHVPKLASGLIISNKSPEPQIGMSSIFDWNQYSTFIPIKHLLNPKGSGRMMTFAEAMDSGFDLPERVFVRPNTGWKPFTGFSCSRGDLWQELNALSQTEHVDPSEIVIVFDEKNIVQEYRYWIVDSKISTCSSYSWDTEDICKKPEKDIDNFVESVLQYPDNIGLTEYVIDVAILGDGSIKVVELNALSTSGWYGAIDCKKLMYDVTMIYGGM